MGALEMESGIYKIVNTTNGKCYVGSAKNFTKRWARHFKDLRNGAHSSIKLQRSYDKHGESVFIPQIIELVEYEKTQIIEREDYWISQLDSKANGYNIADASFGDNLSHHPNRTEIIKKISNSINDNISNMTQHERNKKFGQPGKLNGMFGRTHTEETKRLLSEINIGNSHRLGKKLANEDTRAKLSEIAKLRVGELNPFHGHTHSDEAKAKMSESAKGRRNTSCHKAIVVNGVEYACLKDATVATGIKPTTIWHRCRSENKKFKDTYLVEN